MTERGRAREPAAAEFDDYADGYAAGMDDPVKRLLGRDQTNYIGVKAEWLIRDLARGGGTGRLLDYGCGTAILLGVLRELGYGGSLCGCDVSDGMLAEARRTWRWGELPELGEIRGGRADFADASFDVVVASGVLHHVPPSERAGAYADVLRLLVPGGRAYVFEHNPLNPVTSWVVKRLPIDRDAVLLRAGEARRGLEAAGLRDVRTSYLMFVPPRMRRLRRAERWLRWLPMGGQYVVSAGRPR